MVINYLKNISSELLEEKLNLESKQNNINIKISENIKFLNRLREEDEQNYDAFSPRKQNVSLRENIRKLETEQNSLKQESESLKQQIKDINAKMDELDEVIKITKKMQAENETAVEYSLKGRDIVKYKVLETQEKERQRIARDLHDSSVQSLTSMIHKIELCSKLVDVDPIRCKLELSTLSKMVKDIIEEMREIIYDLHPILFEDIGFDVTLERELSKIQEQGVVSISYTVEGEPYQLEPIMALTLLRAIQEACNNSVKHAEATMISVKMFYEENQIRVIVKDDGKGFIVSEQENDIRDDYSGFGLSTMKERINLLSGEMNISSKIGEGTKIIIEVPKC